MPPSLRLRKSDRFQSDRRRHQGSIVNHHVSPTAICWPGATDITGHAGQAPRLLNRTAIPAGGVVSEALAVEGTHRYQLAALATLDAFGAVSHAGLCRRTNIDRGDRNAVVDALEAVAKARVMPAIGVAYATTRSAP